MLSRISKLILLFIVTELCVGGGGRFTSIGPLSLRMILFGTAMILTIAMLATGDKILPRYWILLGAFAAVILIGVVVGINHNERKLLWEDIKPLLYFFMLPFFVLTIDKKEIEIISGIFKKGSIVLAIFFFLILGLIHTQVIPFLSFYGFTNNSGELFYRGELSFFYKGFLFLGIGVIFFYFTKSKSKNLAIVFLIAAILFSVTRGLIFSLAVTFSIYFLWEKRIYRSAICGFTAFVILVWGNQFTIGLSRWMDSSKHQTSFNKSSPHLFGDRKYSDDGRTAQAKEVLQTITPLSAIIGHGFGQGTPSRPIHMEIAYLEVFHKQGILGLAFWLAVAAMIFLAFRSSDQGSASKAFVLGSFFVFVESATNQYFNNPIGLSVLLLSLVCLDKLKKEK